MASNDMTKAIMNVISGVSVFTITRYFIKIAPVLHSQKAPQTEPCCDS